MGDIVKNDKPRLLCIESSNCQKWAILPTEEGGGIVFTQEEVLDLSFLLSKLYKVYIERFSIKISENYNIQLELTKIIVRRAVVPLLHCFVDRLGRIKRALLLADNVIELPVCNAQFEIDSIDTFESLVATDPCFNQYIINFVAGIWDLRLSCREVEFTSYRKQKEFKNNLFNLYKKNIYRYVKKRFYKFASNIFRKKIATLSMANAHEALEEHGFYLKYLQEVSVDYPLLDCPVDEKIRSELFESNIFLCVELDDVLSKLKISLSERQRTVDKLRGFFTIYYPTTLLESIIPNIKIANQNLPKKIEYLIVSGARCTNSTYMTVAAKQKQIKIINHQHGGHYGYIKDLPIINEIEYPGIDQVISWGWKKLPEDTGEKSLSIVDLPSPWLSERKKYWSNFNVTSHKEYDVLFMPNAIKRFPVAPHGSSVLRRDLIHVMAESYNKLIYGLLENKIKIYHKPYNFITHSMFKNTILDIENKFDKNYYTANVYDKGLSLELLNSCHIVLWDQPGTGFLECLVSNIPTMAYWPRLYSHEENWAKQIFKKLEDVGIIHRSVENLTKEVLAFKCSPDEWMSYTDRVVVIKKFCHEYARVSDDWPSQWRNYLTNLNYA